MIFFLLKFQNNPNLQVGISNVKNYINYSNLPRLMFIQINLYKNKNLHNYCIFLDKI